MPQQYIIVEKFFYIIVDNLLHEMKFICMRYSIILIRPFRINY